MIKRTSSTTVGRCSLTCIADTGSGSSPLTCLYFRVAREGSRLGLCCSCQTAHSCLHLKCHHLTLLYSLGTQMVVVWPQFLPNQLLLLLKFQSQL